MKEYRKPRGVLAKAVAAVIVICVLTALACGGIILLGNLGFFRSDSGATEYYAAGKTYSTLRAATDAAEAGRTQGRAGCVLAAEDGFFEVYALYSSRTDAEGVAERLNAEVQVVSIRAVKFDGECAEECVEAFAAVLDTVTGAEKIWRELDEYRTSESLSVRTLALYSAALSGYSGLESVGALCARVAGYIDEVTAGGSVSVSAGAKYISAKTAIELSEYTRAK